MPYILYDSAMAESPDGRGVLLFGGHSDETYYEDRILELHAGANSWNILNTTLKNGRCKHVVIPFQWFILITSTIYSCSEKLITEKCKHKANQPEKNLLKIKDFMKDLFRNLSWTTWKKYFFIQMNICFKVYLLT